MQAEILIVEDETDMCLMLKEGIEAQGYSCQYVHSGTEALAKMQETNFDIVITDYNIPGINGIDLCKHITDKYPKCAVIVITAFGTMETAVNALRHGAYDFISKPFDMETIFNTLKRTIDYLDLSYKVESLEAFHNNSFKGIIGQSRALISLIENVKVFADTDTSVLITGESGTGKELFAKALHSQSDRKDLPFVAINCSALSEHLLESELFGHTQGAYTDAKKSRKGLFQKANGGTIFLDEIGDMPLNLQAKLLRTLEEKKVRPVGSDVTFSFDARIISATNCDLHEAIQNNKFREDLFYRINVIELKIPPLRERPQDIIILCQSFLKVYCAKYSKKLMSLSKKTHELINKYSWPGNVRELKNSIEHAVIVCKTDTITPGDLPDRIYGESYQKENDDTPLNVVERNHILRVFKSTGGNKEETAKILGVSKRTLYRRLDEYSKEGYL